MRIMVTGHKGYIGSVMVPILINNGHEVVGLDTDLFSKSLFSPEISHIPYSNKDIRDVVAEDLEGYDAVIHLAALSNDPLGNLNPDLTFEINYAATVRLAELAKEVGVNRFLFSSSCSVYGASGNRSCTEESEPNPMTPYAESKLLAERGIIKLHDEEFSPVIMRSATAYGVSPRIRFDLVLNNLIAWAHTTGSVLLKSDGSAWRPVVHVEDISRSFLAVLNAPIGKVASQILNVGSTEENFRVKELAAIVQKTVPGSVIDYVDNASADVRSYRVEFGKIRETINYHPVWTASRGARQLHQEYKQVGLSRGEFEGPQYKRIEHLKKLLSIGHIDRSLRPTNAVLSVPARTVT